MGDIRGAVEKLTEQNLQKSTQRSEVVPVSGTTSWNDDFSPATRMVRQR